MECLEAILRKHAAQKLPIAVRTFLSAPSWAPYLNRAVRLQYVRINTLQGARFLLRNSCPVTKRRGWRLGPLQSKVNRMGTGSNHTNTCSAIKKTQEARLRFCHNQNRLLFHLICRQINSFSIPRCLYNDEFRLPVMHVTTLVKSSSETINPLLANEP